jgi:hypothetical protein
MLPALRSLFLTLRTWAHSRAALQLEILALRHQLQVLQRTRPRQLRLAKTDRWLWVVLSRLWPGWRRALVIVKPETVIAWHRRGFRLWWTWKSRCRTGRPTVPADIRTLIRTMAVVRNAGGPNLSESIAPRHVGQGRSWHFRDVAAERMYRVGSGGHGPISFPRSASNRPAHCV